MDIRPGSVVVALRDGGHDAMGLPRQRPIAGKTYRITSIYEMAYGLGCTLEGMDPRPYKGYFLRVDRPLVSMSVPTGMYFKPIEVADDEFTATLYEYIRSKEHESAQRPGHTADSGVLRLGSEERSGVRRPRKDQG